MAKVSDLSLADLCRELHQPSLPPALPSSSSSDDNTEEISNCPHNYPNEDDTNYQQVVEKADHFNVETGFSVQENGDDNEEEFDDGKYLSFEEFRKQTEELSLFLDNLKQTKLEREREVEELQIQSYVEEKSAAYSELDSMVNYINNVKTTFTPPEKERPTKKEKVTTNKGLVNGQIAATPLVGKGKYASKGKKDKSRTAHNYDDSESTLAIASNSFSSPREVDVEMEEGRSQQGDEEEQEYDDDEVQEQERKPTRKKVSYQNQAQEEVDDGDDEGENTSMSDDSEVIHFSYILSW